jgi:hypothetical protein
MVVVEPHAMSRASLHALGVLALGWVAVTAAEIPKPEHPTPGAVRAHWSNLNGPWQFRFDPRDEGRRLRWSEPDAPGFDRTITVPFGWESELSGIHQREDRGVAWYRRRVRVPDDFAGTDRIWLHFGAVDWLADVWVNGRHVATHEGGYSPFATDITEAVRPGEPAVVTVRAFDPTDPNLPTGKQVGWYTPTSGIWQTVWLESRPRGYIDTFTIHTTTNPATAAFDVALAGLPAGRSTVTVRSDDPTVAPASTTVTVTDAAACCGPGDPGQPRAAVSVAVAEPRLWTPESPHLYDVTIELTAPDGQVDAVRTYFGLRTIARGRYGDAPFERILLNDKPIYLRAALDQSFNPKGIYTAPDDAFLRRDIQLAKELGLNGLRIHIKPDEPRRLYWADRLGLLILEDLPNTWRQNVRARQAWEKTMREVVARDRNHPAIIAWVAFNETWGLGTPAQYKSDRDTQDWVRSVVAAIRRLDPTRLVEDNSPCNFDHVETTDLNSWHFYIDDPPRSRAHIAEVVAQTEPGSRFNYCPGLTQSTAPLINSEYGAVSAGGGDRDISWGFRDLTTQLRRHAKIQGYVYTELTDIEWEHNGFVNYDRTPKDFGYEAFLPGMTVADLQGDDFIGYDAPPAIVAKPGEEITVPLFVSHYSQRRGSPKLRWRVVGVADRAEPVRVAASRGRTISWTPYGVNELEPLKVEVPTRPFVGALVLTLHEETTASVPGDRPIAANFVNIVVKPDQPQPRLERQGERDVIVRFTPGDFARQQWSESARPPAGKVYGRGKGFFEYQIELPQDVIKARPESIRLWLEAAAKAGREKVDWPQRVNPRDYPQTDTRKWPSTLEVALNGHVIGRRTLSDDPADARGVLSHLARNEHGSFGELVQFDVPLPEPVRADLAAGQPLVIRLAVPDDAKPAGGLCLFGAETGRYPFDPTLVISTREPMPTDSPQRHKGHKETQNDRHFIDKMRCLFFVSFVPLR